MVGFDGCRLLLGHSALWWERTSAFFDSAGVQCSMTWGFPSFEENFCSILFLKLAEKVKKPSWLKSPRVVFGLAFDSCLTLTWAVKTLGKVTSPRHENWFWVSLSGTEKVTRHCDFASWSRYLKISEASAGVEVRYNIQNMLEGFICKVKCKISVLSERREYCWTKRCQAAQGKILFLKNFGVRLRMRASSVYEPIVWVSGRDWNLGDSPGVASSLLRDGATLTATLSANPWGIELFFIGRLFKEWGGNFRLSPCYKRPLMMFLSFFVVFWSTWWVTDEFWEIWMGKKSMLVFELTVLVQSSFGWFEWAETGGHLGLF